MSEIVLDTQGLTVRFGGVTAVDCVDFALYRNELRCLIGPNGAGKSTFFKCLTGMQRPSEGEIRIAGEETTGWHPHEIARLGIGIKTQTPSVMDSLTVRENIWLAAYRCTGRRNANNVVSDTLDRLELGTIATARVGALAHGERQMVELGLVIAGRPWLVLLDEPAAGLTGHEVERMAVLVAEMNREAAMIIVDHDMQFIRSIAQRVTVFVQGRVLIEDHIDQVMANSDVRDVYLGKRN